MSLAISTSLVIMAGLPNTNWHVTSILMFKIVRNILPSLKLLHGLKVLESTPNWFIDYNKFLEVITTCFIFCINLMQIMMQFFSLIIPRNKISKLTLLGLCLLINNYGWGDEEFPEAGHNNVLDILYKLDANNDANCFS